MQDQNDGLPPTPAFRRISPFIAAPPLSPRGEGTLHLPESFHLAGYPRTRQSAPVVSGATAAARTCATSEVTPRILPLSSH